jgi:FixJ family two-component response regulator
MTIQATCEAGPRRSVSLLEQGASEFSSLVDGFPILMNPVSPDWEQSEGLRLNMRHVYIVDDDRDVRCSLSFMLRAADFEPRPFDSGTDFLASVGELPPGCVLLDIRMPTPDGFGVMAELARRGVQWPVIVITGHSDIEIAVKAMKRGAVDFLEKPVDGEILLAALERGFLMLRESGETAGRRRAAHERISGLSPRETEVLRGLMLGRSNKILARQLDISLRTVEMHRANMIERLGVKTLPEALRLAMTAGWEPLN